MNAQLKEYLDQLSKDELAEVRKYLNGDVRTQDGGNGPPPPIPPKHP